MMKVLKYLAICLLLCLFAISSLSADKAGSIISGTIIDNDEKPVANAKVFVSVQRDGKQKIDKLFSNKKGQFISSFQLSEKNPFALVYVLAKGYCASRVYCSTNQKPPLEITLFRGSTLNGKVIDEKGKPLAWAKVTLEHANAWCNNTSIDFDLPNDRKTITTGGDGTFCFANMPNPEDFRYINVTISVTAPGRALIRKYVSQESISAPVRIVDPVECRIYGKLYLPDKNDFAPEGTPIIVQVPTENDMSRGSEARQVTVGKNGFFKIDKLPPTKVNVMLGTSYSLGKVKPMDWALPAVLGLELSPKRAQHLGLTLVPGALVKGKIVDKVTGTGVESARIYVDHPGRPVGTFQDLTATDVNGNFAIRVVEGQATISVESVQAKQYVWFQEDERPTLTVYVVQGEEKSDVKLPIDLNQNSQSLYAVQDKPDMPDLELVPGTYDLAWDPDIDCSDAIYTGERYNGVKADALIKQRPKFISSNAKSVVYVIDGNGDEGLLFAAFDESKGVGKGWDTAYIDANRNGDLSDDAPIPVDKSANSDQLHSDWVTVKTFQGEKDARQEGHPIQVRITAYVNRSSNYFYSQLNRKGGWKGTIDTSKGKIECIALDVNTNGMLGDCNTINGERYEFEEAGDNIYIDTNGFGKTVVKSWSPHRIFIQRVSKVADKYYNISVSRLGDKLTVEPYKGDHGQLLVLGDAIEGIKATTDQVSVICSSGYYTFKKCDGKALTLPTDKYKLISCDMVLDTKNKLRLTCSSNELIQIESQKQTAMGIGGKLSFSLVAEGNDPFMTQGSACNITWDLKIGGKTKINSWGNSYDMNSPTISFLKNGKVIDKVTAGYT